MSKQANFRRHVLLPVKSYQVFDEPSNFFRILVILGVMWQALGSPVAAGCEAGFWASLTVWLNKPHVINRRLCGACTRCNVTVTTCLDSDALVTTVRKHADNFTREEGLTETTHSVFLVEEGDDDGRNIEVYVRDLHPKLLDKFSTQREVVVFDRGHGVAVFIPVAVIGRSGQASPCHQPAYRVAYSDNSISISMETTSDNVKQQPSDHRNIEETTGPEKNSKDFSVAADIKTCPTSEGTSCVTSDTEVTSCVTSDTEVTSCVTSDTEVTSCVTSDTEVTSCVTSDTEVTSCVTSDTEVTSCLTSGAGVTSDWLTDQLLVKVARWSFLDDLNTAVTSLKLVPLDRYNQRYNEMKNKYGPHLVQNWPESTDPQKFVFEDIAIAAYLLTLWEEERVVSGDAGHQSFVDLGCGNGLLVYLLTEEGHPGKGIDLRRRAIWDFYGPRTQLEEFALTPSDQNLFAGYDWLIGNHSDELTPWIPVIAARSSYTCRYFVLPCCSHDFDAKFREKAQGRSQYRCYLDFVRVVGETCGFNVQEDTLRIPSTKRVCFIGQGRTYSAEDETEVDAERKSYIASRCTGNSPPRPTNNHHSTPGQEEDQWAGGFQARSSEEVARNCVNLDPAVKARVVDAVFAAVLSADGGERRTLPDDRTWNTGGRLPLGDVVSLVSPEDLRLLKSECGGLQTLLRNHYHVFRVQAGHVHIRDMGAEDEAHWARKKKQKGPRGAGREVRKTRLCYLHQRHPDGCPRTAAECRFAHGEGELRPRDEAR